MKSSSIRSNEDDLKRARGLINWIWPKAGLWQRVLRIIILLVLLPYLLMFAYWPAFVHPISTLMMGDLLMFQGYDRRWMKLEDVSPVLVESVMMSEDGRFCSHHGIDFVQLRSVIDDALSGEKTRGASTITMQTARNLFLWNGRSFVRKALELPLALSLDFVWPKPRVMEVYLNIAEWGPHIYGVEAAARHYFKTSAAKLSARQAALLAAALPNPYVRHPDRPTRGMKAIANLIARRAAASGEYIQCIYP